MPVKSSSSSTLQWPDAATVRAALDAWSAEVVARSPEVRGVGYFGSYAREDWGVGSDLDVILVVDSTEDAPERRAARWDTTPLPVPVDLLVYTRDEWERVARQGRFGATLARELTWVFHWETRAPKPGRRDRS